ncbi:hypothetical protein DFH09DRAFT_1184138 [Mycena vulgaris]|nr:hypothetical protein DFH09DRAFT_1184138 [Mycena vulgaris]
MIALTQWYSNDNDRRQWYLDNLGKDLDRSTPDLWLPTLQLENKFQLTVLHPRHFHPDDNSCINIVGADGRLKSYRASPDGVLKDEHGVPLPPFAQNTRNMFTQLNPVLVNFAAALRFRRLKRMDPRLLINFSADTLAVIDASLKLYAAVMCTPILPDQEEGSAIHVGSVDTRNVEMGAGPSGTSGGMRDSGDDARTDSGDNTFNSIFKTLGREKAMDVVLGGYAFEQLPDLIPDDENGGASPPRPTTPPSDEDPWDVIPAEVSGMDFPKGRTESNRVPLTESILAGGRRGAGEGPKGLNGRACNEVVMVAAGEES